MLNLGHVWLSKGQHGPAGKENWDQNRDPREQGIAGARNRGKHPIHVFPIMIDPAF